MRSRRVIAMVLVLALCPVALAQRDKLEIGDPAPALEIETWVNGEPVQLTPDGVYVVVFLQSGNRQSAGEGASRSVARMEKLVDLFGHKGLEVILVSTQSAEDIAADIKTAATRKGFSLAADRRSRTQRGWVRAAEITDLPVGFIVGRGKIMHFGKLGEEDFQNILVQVLTGRYDPELQAQAQPLLNAARRARRVKNWRMAGKQYDEVISLDPQVFAVIALEKFEMMLVDMDDEDTAYEFAAQGLIAQNFERDDGALQMLATRIVLDPALDDVTRNLDVALAAAKAAAELAGPSDPGALATLAMVHFHRGEYAEAVNRQSRAYFMALPAEKAEYKRVLGTYREAANRAGARAGR